MFFLVVQYVAARARLRPARLRPRVPAVQPRHLRDVAGHARGSSAGSARAPMMVIGTIAPDGRLRLAQHARQPTAPTAARSSARCCSTGSPPAWSSCRSPSTVLGGVEPEHAGVGLRAAADHPAARRRGRRRRDRLGVRRRRGARRVPPRRRRPRSSPRRRIAPPWPCSSRSSRWPSRRAPASPSRGRGLAARPPEPRPRPSQQATGRR